MSQHVTHSYQITGNQIEDTEVTLIGEALKSNTALTTLDLSCKQKKKRHIKNSRFCICFNLIKSSDNKMENTGATALGEGLMSNTTLTTLKLNGLNDPRNNTLILD